LSTYFSCGAEIVIPILLRISYFEHPVIVLSPVEKLLRPNPEPISFPFNHCHSKQPLSLGATIVIPSNHCHSERSEESAASYSTIVIPSGARNLLPA